jgi:hypothetical protein
MFYAVLEFVMELSMLYLLITMFILIDLLLRAIRARRFNEARERMDAMRLRNQERRERRKIGDRPANPSRAMQPTASLADVVIRRGQKTPGFGRRAAL